MIATPVRSGGSSGRTGASSIVRARLASTARSPAAGRPEGSPGEGTADRSTVAGRAADATGWALLAGLAAVCAGAAVEVVAAALDATTSCGTTGAVAGGVSGASLGGATGSSTGGGATGTVAGGVTGTAAGATAIDSRCSVAWPPSLAWTTTSYRRKALAPGGATMKASSPVAASSVNWLASSPPAMA